MAYSGAIIISSCLCRVHMTLLVATTFTWPCPCVMIIFRIIAILSSSTILSTFELFWIISLHAVFVWGVYVDDNFALSSIYFNVGCLNEMVYRFFFFKFGKFYIFIFLNEARIPTWFLSSYSGSYCLWKASSTLHKLFYNCKILLFSVGWNKKGIGVRLFC